MFLGKVIGGVDSDETNSRACDHSRLKMVQKLDLYQNPSGPSTIAADFIGAGDGDIVLVGTPPAGTNTMMSTAQEMATGIMIMGIVGHDQLTARSAARD